MPRWGCSCRPANRPRPTPPGSPDRPLDVLESELAQGVELRLEAALDRFAHVARDDDPARRRLGLQAGRNVHAIAVEVVAIDDQVAEMQADAEHDGGVLRLVSIGLDHGLLELDGGAQRIDGAGELDQGAVAGQLDQPATVSGECRLQSLLAMLAQARQRAALVPPHQAGVADNVCSEDRCQFALLTGQ